MNQDKLNKPASYNGKGIMNWLTRLLDKNVTNEQLDEIIERYRTIEAEIVNNCRDQLQQQALQSKSMKM